MSVVTPVITATPIARINPVAKLLAAVILSIALLLSIDWISAAVALGLEAILLFWGGLSLRQTAEAMGVSEGTLKSRLHADLNPIRRILE